MLPEGLAEEEADVALAAEADQLGGSESDLDGLEAPPVSPFVPAVMCCNVWRRAAVLADDGGAELGKDFL